MEELKRMLRIKEQTTRFTLDIQLFAETGDPASGSEPPEGNGDDQEPPATVSKELFDKTSKELASLKKALKAKQTDEERFAAEKEEREARIKELEDFQRKSTLSTSLLKGGVGEKDVDAIADAFIENDPSKVAEAFNKALLNLVNAKDAEIAQLKLNSIEKPSGANGNTEVTAESFAKMTVDERIELKIKDPELYKQFNKK